MYKSQRVLFDFRNVTTLVKNRRTPLDLMVAKSRTLKLIHVKKSEKKNKKLLVEFLLVPGVV